MRNSYFLLMLLPFLQSCFGWGDPKLLWHVPIASRTEPIIQNGTVYVRGFHSGHPEENYHLFALDEVSGKQRWECRDSVLELYGESGGYVFFRNEARHLVQLDAKTGEKVHESEDDDTPFLNWIIEGDIMYIVNSSNEVVAVNNRENKILWRVQPTPKAFHFTKLQRAGKYILFSGKYSGGGTQQFDQYGEMWALDPQTGKTAWGFEPPPPHDFAPLDVLVHDSYVIATNTSPLKLQTHVLDADTGKELYPPIVAFDFSCFYEGIAYASGGAFDLRTGQRLGNGEKGVAASVIQNGIAWHVKMTGIGWKSFFLRLEYDGDVRGRRDWTNTPPNSSIEGLDMETGKPVFNTKEYQFTGFSMPVISNGVLFHTGLAIMREGKSGVWAYRLPGTK